MDTRWLRFVSRRYGVAGLLFVGCVVCAVAIWKSSRLRSLLFGVGLCLLALGAVIQSDVSAGRPRRYTLTLLGQPAVDAYYRPAAINADGVVVGAHVRGHGVERSSTGFIWKAGRFTAITVPTYSNTGLTGINDAGQASGSAWRARYSDQQAISWRAGTIHLLPSSEGARSSGALGINSAGEMVGSTLTRKLAEYSCLWKDGSIVHLHQGNRCLAGAINDRGDITESVLFGHFIWEAFLLSGGRRIDLIGLGGYGDYALAINNHRKIVGCSEYDPEDWEKEHACFWETNRGRDLGTLGGTSSVAYGINDGDEIVGTAQTAKEEAHAFVWRNGVLQDLNDLIADRQGFVLEAATAINGRGQIIAVGRSGETKCGLLLTPR